MDANVLLITFTIIFTLYLLLTFIYIIFQKFSKKSSKKSKLPIKNPVAYYKKVKLNKIIYVFYVFLVILPFTKIQAIQLDKDRALLGIFLSLFLVIFISEIIFLRKEDDNV